MAFDFGKIEVDDDDLAEFIGFYDQFRRAMHEITDIAERSQQPKEATTVWRKGYWEAGRYFTMHLEQQLQELGYHPLTDSPEKNLNLNKRLDVNGFIGMLGNAMVFWFDLNQDLDKPIKLANFKKYAVGIGISIMENTPIIVFQQYDGPIATTIPEAPKITVELDQEAYCCRKDAVVFRGVYKATKVEEDKYQLERIFDKYFFNIDNAFSYDRRNNKSVPVEMLLVSNGNKAKLPH